MVLLLLCGLPRLYADGVLYQINCGGPAASPAVPTGFACDAYASGGDKYSTTAAIDTSGVVGPAPQSAYQTERYGPLFSYSFPNLLSGASYVVRLHFAEYRYGATGYNNKPARLFNVSINSQTVLSNFDVYATAGAKYKAVTETFSTTADSNGKITVYFNGGTDNAEIKAIEILGQQVLINVNNTSKTTDDLVRLTSDTPVRKFTTPCTIQAIGTQSADLNVSLSCQNGASRVGFDKSATAGTEASTLTLTLPKDGTPVTFYIVGDLKSTAIGDANIQVVDAFTNQFYGAQSVTVFWFDKPMISATPDKSYSLNDTDFEPLDGNAVNLTGQTILMPGGLNSSAPQLQRLRLGVEQNFEDGIYQVIWTADPSTLVWNPAAPAGIEIHPPDRYTAKYIIPACVDTILSGNVPIYSKTSEAFKAFSTVGFTNVSTFDAPSVNAASQGPNGNPVTFQDPGSGVVIATMVYNPVASINVSFMDWLTVYEDSATSGKQTQWLSETDWADYVSSAVGAAKKATSSGANKTLPKDIDTPIETGLTANQIINNGQGVAMPASSSTTYTSP